MSITIGSNIAALQAQRRLNEGSATLSRIYERLSSGQRINHASDDAAGLSVASTLNNNARIYTQAIRNANDGVSGLSIAEGGLQALSSIVTRIQELAEQAANGVYSSPQRQALDNEAQALRSEYSRVVDTTTFNGLSLLTKTQEIQVQVGIDGAASSRIGITLGGLTTTTSATGTFGAEQLITSVNSGDLSSADVNGDGNADLLYGVGFEVRLGNGDGSFKAETAVYSGNYGFGNRFASADLNGDGFVDVLTGGGANNSLVVLLGNGNGTFKPAVSYAIPNTYDLTTGDFNGDGFQDIAARPLSGSESYVALNNGDGTFQALMTIGSAVSSLATGDVNGDGFDDLLTAAGVVSAIHLSNGNGTFSDVALSSTSQFSVSPEISDINGDGIADLMASANGNIGIYLGNGNGSFAFATVVSAGTYVSALRIGDINGDGRTDIISTDYTAGIQVLLGNGDGSFQNSSANAGTQAGFEMTLNDFNNDGVLDVAAGIGNNIFGVYLGQSMQHGGLPSFSLTSAPAARIALESMSTALQNINTSLGVIGAAQSRLSIAAASAMSAREGSLAAASRITDADIAEESAQLSRMQILQKAASAVLAQANQQPALALQLLRGG